MLAGTLEPYDDRARRFYSVKISRRPSRRTPDGLSRTAVAEYEQTFTGLPDLKLVEDASQCEQNFAHQDQGMRLGHPDSPSKMPLDSYDVHWTEYERDCANSTSSPPKLDDKEQRDAYFAL